MDFVQTILSLAMVPVRTIMSTVMENVSETICNAMENVDLANLDVEMSVSPSVMREHTKFVME